MNLNFEANDQPQAAERSLGVACASGGFRGVFVQGVLAAFEAAGLKANAYAASSVGVFPAAAASVGRASELGLSSWQGALNALRRSGGQMSAVVDWLTDGLLNGLRDSLFKPGVPRLLVAASQVINPQGLQQAVSSAARLGRQLLVQASRHENGWADENLRLRLFDSRGLQATAAGEEAGDLTPENLAAVVQASTRLMPAWSQPAWVSGVPYLDAVYTCSCPAPQLAAQGYRRVLAIATAPGPLMLNLFSNKAMPKHINGAEIFVITPERPLADFGVDVRDATPEGLVAAYQHGMEVGRRFLDALGDLLGAGPALAPT